MNYQINPVSSNISPFDLISCTEATGTYQDCNRYVEKPLIIDNPKYWDWRRKNNNESFNCLNLFQTSFDEEIYIQTRQVWFSFNAKQMAEELLKTFFINLRNTIEHPFTNFDFLDLF